MMQFKKRKKARIEMLPLIDTVFLVLVVFIYAMLSMVVHRGLPVQLPTASTSVSDQKDYLALTILPNETIFFNEQTCDFDLLYSRLMGLSIQDKAKPLYLNADKAVQHGLVVKVLNLVRQAGIHKVVIEAKEEEI